MSLRIQPALTKFQRGWQREESRARVAMEATIETVHGRISGFILNLSCHGAMVQSAQPLSRGNDIVLQCGPLDVIGKVAWAREGRLGVEFDEPIEEDLVIELRHLADDAARYATPRPSTRPGLAIRPLTRAEQEVAQQWATSGAFR